MIPLASWLPNLKSAALCSLTFSAPHKFTALIAKIEVALYIRTIQQRLTKSHGLVFHFRQK